MYPGLKIEAVRRKNSLAVDWHDCSWVPAIVVQSPPPRIYGRPRILTSFSPSPPPREERAGVRRPIVSRSNPLTPTLSSLGRGEGVDRVTKPLLPSPPVLHTVCHNLSVTT